MFGAQSAMAGANWIGDAAIKANGTWYYCGKNLGSWCTGGAFNGANLGTISSLAIGGQCQVHDASDGNWGSGDLAMNYKIDSKGDGVEITISYNTYGGDYGKNMMYQSGGTGSFTTTPIDLSGLSEGTHTIEFWFGPLDGCYDSNNSSNYKASFTISKATISLASACTYDSKYYGTYSNASAFEVPSDLTVAAVSVAAGVLTVTPYSTGDIVTAGEGVLVSSTTDGDHTIYLTGATGTSKDGNMLIGTGDAGIDDTEMDDLTGHKFYRLTMHNGTQIGFYWGAASGAAFDLAANKAYLAVPDGEIDAPARFWMDENATDIKSIDAVEEGVKFFQNGKLYIKKNGVVYDMVGAIVK